MLFLNISNLNVLKNPLSEERFYIAGKHFFTSYTMWAKRLCVLATPNETQKGSFWRKEA